MAMGQKEVTFWPTRIQTATRGSTQARLRRAASGDHPRGRPKARALFEMTREVLKGVVTTYKHFEIGAEPACCPLVGSPLSDAHALRGGIFIAMQVIRQFLRGVVPIHILHHAAQGDVHGAWLAEELAEHGYRISPGTLYPLLHRMEAAGLLSSRTEIDAGRVLRLYVATEVGRVALADVRHLISELAREVLGAET